MRRLIGFLFSLAVSLLVTWAGLHYDSAIFYAGLLLVLIVLVLWVYAWAHRSTAPRSQTIAPLLDERPPMDADGAERAMFSLDQARKNGRIALANRSEGQARRVLSEIQSAMISCKKEFGIPALSLRGEGGYRDFLRVWLRYLDCFYPLLRDGHHEEARQQASKFRV